MNKLYRALTLLIALFAIAPAWAGNENNTNGTTADFVWQYWNDVKTDGAYWPNWKITLNSGSFAEYAPNGIVFDWELLKDGEHFNGAAPGPSWQDATNATAYAELGVLPAGKYTMKCTVKFVSNASTTEYPLNDIVWDCKGPDPNFPTITLTCGNTQALTGTTGTFDYKLDVINAQKVVDYSIFAVKAGEVRVLQETRVTELEGTLPLSNLNPGVTDFWVKVRANLDNGGTYPVNEWVQYPGAAQGWSGLSIDTGDLADFAFPTLEIEASNAVATGLTTGTLDYRITAKNDKDVESYNIWVVTFGEKVVSEQLNTTDLVGQIKLENLNEGDVTELWIKCQAVMRDDNGVYPTNPLSYPGAAQGYTGLSIDTWDGSTVRKPTIDLKAFSPQVTGETTGTINYQLTVNYPESVKSYEIWVERTGDVKVGSIESTTELEGTIDLSDLLPAKKNPLWVKVIATLTDDTKMEMVQYPGAAQGWAGLEIDMTLQPGTVIPTLSVVGTNPQGVTKTTGTLDYQIAVKDADSVESYTVWVVTNGEKLLGQLTTTDLEGTIALTGLNSNTTTDLWIKAFATLEGGMALGDVAGNQYQAQFPGEAQGWTGLSISTAGCPDDEEDGIATINGAVAEPVGYYDLQGRKVANPASGLYIVRYSDGTAAKVLVK
nr:hypothetical protein [Bacteroides sp.]